MKCEKIDKNWRRFRGYYFQEVVEYMGSSIKGIKKCCVYDIRLFLICIHNNADGGIIKFCEMPIFQEDM